MTDKEENHGLEQARAQYSSICEMVAALSVDYDRLADLKDERESLAYDAVMSGQDSAERIMAEAALRKWDEENGAELKELSEAAGDCESQDAARDRIQEDPLCVEVQSGWYNPCSLEDTPPPEEFQILLCTGGPAVRIMGELDENGTPTRAWMEYQDWGTPWTRFFGTDQETLLAYASEFYFGGEL